MKTILFLCSCLTVDRLRLEHVSLLVASENELLRDILLNNYVLIHNQYPIPEQLMMRIIERFTIGFI